MVWLAAGTWCGTGCRCNDAGATHEGGAVKLDGLTLEGMSTAARAEGLRVREVGSEREELPGATIVRMTLDHARRGTAFVDLYDFSDASAHADGPAVKVGPAKTLFVRVFAAKPASEALLAGLVAATPLEGQTRETLEATLREGGWTLGDSSKLEDDISGHDVVDVVAHKGDTNALVVLLDYAKVASGKEQSAVAVDGERVLLVDTDERVWSRRLLRHLAE